MATSATTNRKKNSGEKKSSTIRLTTNDKLVLKRARVLPRGKTVAPKKETTDESNATTRK
jgi:hypothetical protein